MGRPYSKTLNVLVVLALISFIAMILAISKLSVVAGKAEDVTRISYQYLNVDVMHSSTEAMASVSCAKETKLILVSRSKKSFLYCSPEDGNIILSADEVDTILVLGEPLGAYTELNLKEDI